MAEPHCSKCCPGKTEPPAPRPDMLTMAWVWFGAGLAVIAASWGLLVWLGASLWR